MRVPNFIFSRLPHTWKWVRARHGGKWELWEFYDSIVNHKFYCWKQVKAFSLVRYHDEEETHLFHEYLEKQEDYTPMLPMPTELTSYRG